MPSPYRREELIADTATLVHIPSLWYYPSAIIPLPHGFSRGFLRGHCVKKCPLDQREGIGKYTMPSPYRREELIADTATLVYLLSALDNHPTCTL
jgi:hypothetical protein